MSSPGHPPIGDLGLIGDTRTAALVDPHGSIVWWCLPRFDSSPVFGSLVGGPDAGYFSITPPGPLGPPKRSYVDATATLTTTWPVPGGELSVRDSMVGDVTGALLPSTLLVRRVAASGREVCVRVRLAPRFGYGRNRPSTVRHDAGSVVIAHNDLVLAVTTDAGRLLPCDEAVELVVRPEHPVTVAVSVMHRAPAVTVPATIAAQEAERDEGDWARWAGGITVDSPHRPTIVRSLVTLRLLTYSPSGAPVAAPTTSLPESVGGTRNWDYRYSWPRDASIGIAAFLAAGKPEQARSFLAWLRHASRTSRPRLPALLTLDGRPAPDERGLDGWPGYHASRPVRVGNGASSQHQLDGYGWVVDAAWLFARSGEPLDGETWRTVRAFADHVAWTWQEPDAGIWERRDQLRHHVHSKLMAWLALDRGALIADRVGGRASRHARRWRTARDHVGADVRRRGYNDRLGAYTAAYGTTELDAAVLLLPLIGVEAPGSPRVRSTIDAIATRLSAGGPLLYRYRDSDGLPGDEGAFLPCSFWLVQALAATGRVQEASDLFDRLVTLGGPLGLYGEEMDPNSRAHLGNFPQALTHAALVQAAMALDPAEAQGPPTISNIHDP